MVYWLLMSSWPWNTDAKKGPFELLCLLHRALNLISFLRVSPFLFFQIENLLEQLKDKDKQLAGLRERVQGLQTDSSNTDTALATLEEALSEKVRNRGRGKGRSCLKKRQR